MKVHYLFVIIFLIGFFLRFIQLSSIPNGLYPDETALGYNAYSILVSGKDEHGETYPLYFRSFDDYKLPVYIYLTSAAINFFGEGAFSVRLASAVFGSLSIAALFYLVYVLSKNKYLASVSALFLALNPWHFFFSRAGYEVNVATSFILFGVLFFVLSLTKEKKLYFLIPSAIFFLLSVYTYNVTRLIAPVIFIALIIFYYKNLTDKSKTILITVLTFFLVGMLPFITSFITLQSESGFSSHKDALIIGNATKAEIIETRSYFIDLPPLIQKAVFNYYFLVAFYYVKNLVSFFSTSFFFILGSDKPNQNIGQMAMFYFFEFPLIIAGVYYALKKKAKFLIPVLIWLLAVFIFGSVVRIVPNGTRTFPVVIPLTILSSYGFYILLEKLLYLKSMKVKISVIALSGFVIIYSYLFFFLSYFVRYPIEKAKDWRSEDQKTVSRILELEKNYNEIVFLENSEFFYTSFLYYSRYSPTTYHRSAKYRQSGLVSTLESVGKYKFGNIDWKNESPKEGTLYISGMEELPKSVKVIDEIKYPKRPVGIYYDRKIGQLSVEDRAYIFFEKE